MSKELLDKLRSHLTLEQDFTHRAFMDGMEKLSQQEARELLGIIYANYQIRGRILENIIKYCVAYGVDLPSFGDLLDM
jgi:hypothetical protein